jgi:Ca2+-binding EF-hand superfamily protein
MQMLFAPDEQQHLRSMCMAACARAGAVASKPFEESARKAEEIVRDQFGDELSAEELRMLCKVGEPSCTFHEYALAMMVKLGKIDQDDIDDCARHFQKLDTDNDGVLTVKDLNERERADYSTGHGVRETRKVAQHQLFVGVLSTAPREDACPPKSSAHEEGAEAKECTKEEQLRRP